MALHVNRRPKDDVSDDERPDPVSDPIIHQICAGLARYYKLKGVDYDAIFSKYCEDNGMGDDGVEEELAGAADEAIIVEFDEDDNFPLLIDCTDAEKLETIMRVIKRCYSNPKAYMDSDGKFEPLKVDAASWNITEKDIGAVKRLYKAQLETLFDVGMDKDQSILRLLAVGRNLGVPYLVYLSDVYMREKLKAKLENNNSKLTPFDFITQNKHCQRLKNMQTSLKEGNPAIEVQVAINSFYKRINPQIMLSPSLKIVADLRKTCALIGSAVEFVHNKATNDDLACPFQFDVCFAFKESEEANNVMGVDGDESDGDDDDDEDDEDEKDENDQFGDIMGKMESEKLVRAKSTLEVGHRGFTDPFKDFVEENGMAKKHKAYPRKRRFCAIVDRRKGEAEKDDLIFFEPPENCNSFPDHKEGYVQLWYFDTSKTCILPQNGYDAGKVINAENITVGNAKKSLTLSFHVESADEIRCYLFVNGGMMRFFAQDIIDVLPGFFVTEFADNVKWAKSDVAKALVELMQKQLVDARFSAFYESSLK